MRTTPIATVLKEWIYTFTKELLSTNDKTSARVRLRKHFGQLGLRLFKTTGPVLLTAADFPGIPTTLVTQAITVRKTHKYINDCYRLDVLNFRASRSTYQQLGLAILAVVFSPTLHELCIRFDRPDSDVHLIKIKYEGTTPRSACEYLTMPHSFKYHPAEVYENPWSGLRVPDEHWPGFLLTYSGSEPEKHWEERDIVEGFGSDDAAVLVAALLLDFGRPQNKQNLIKLETPVGYGGVSKLSPEVHFHLPSSKAWPLA